jgi:hypothetical protein
MTEPEAAPEILPPVKVAEPRERLRSHLARDADGLYHVELFIVAAISAVLGIRGLLFLTGYPQLGTATLHIAHMLWGGLLMLAALLLLLTTLERRSRPVAAVIGGLGFGAFIDELGKFITSDNDYFYEPTIALIYLTFIVLFLSLRTLLTRRRLTETEHVVNAMATLQDMLLWDLDVNEKRKAEEHLRQCDSTDVRVALIQGLLAQAATVPAPPPGIYTRVRLRLHRDYRRLVQNPVFAAVLTIGFVAKSLSAVGHTLAAKFNFGQPAPSPEDLARVPSPHWVELIAMLVSTLFVLRGVTRLPRSRLDAYRDFRRSLLITITVGYFFAFYDDQLGALAGLALNLLLFAGIQLLIGLEHSLREARRAEVARGMDAQAAPGVG